MKTVVFLDTYLLSASRGYRTRVGREEIGGQLVAACCQERADWEVRYLRPNTDRPDAAYNLVSQGPCDALVLFPYTYTKWLADEIAKLFKGKLPVIYGGYHSGVNIQNSRKVFLEGLADYVIAGRGDDVLPWLLKELTIRKVAPGALPGQCPTPSGEYPLDDLPWPIRDEGLMQDLTKDPISCMPPKNLEANPRRLVIIAGSMGCSARCDFCSSWMISPKPLHRSPKNIVDEMVWLKQCFGSGLVYHFANPLFNADRNWVMELCTEMEKRGPFPSICMADFCLDREMVRAMKKAGIFLAMMGLEFTDNELRTRRGKRSGDPALAYNLCSQEGIITRAFYMLGRLGMTGEELALETERLLSLPFHPDELRIDFEVPFPGTKVASKLAPDDIVTEQPHWTTEEVVYRTELTREKWQIIRRKIIQDFHFSQNQQEHYARQAAKFPELRGVYGAFLERVEKAYE